MKKKIVRKLFEPFYEVNEKVLILILVTQFIIIGFFLQIEHSDIIPSPINIGKNFFSLISSGNFYDNLFKSLILITKGMGIAIIIALFLSYLSQLLFFKKLISVICSFRYLTLTGLTAIFTILSKDTDSLRTNLLLFAIIPFFTTSMLDVINRTSKQDIELCYTLKKSRWWILWEVIVIGNLDKVFVVISTNFAICFLMLTSVESLAFNLGGIGTMLIVANKYVQLEQIIPLLIAVLLIGILIDYSFNILRRSLFKYSKV